MNCRSFKQRMYDKINCEFLVLFLVVSSPVLANPECSKLEPSTRTDCGYHGITEEECLQNECCFDSSVANVDFCYYPKGTSYVCRQFCNAAERNTFSVAFPSCFSKLPKIVHAEAIDSATCSGFSSAQVIDIHRWGFQVLLEGQASQPCTDLQIRWSAVLSCPAGVGLEFTQGSSYAKYRLPFPVLARATVCAFVQTTRSKFAIFSYASGVAIDDFQIFHFMSPTGQPQLSIYVKNVYDTYALENSLGNGVRTHVCGYFDSSARKTNMYVNGQALTIKKKSYLTQTVTANGIFIIGQEQDNLGGGFDFSQANEGTISNLVIFNRILSSDEMNSLREKCHCPADYIVLITKSNMQLIGSDVQVSEYDSC